MNSMNQIGNIGIVLSGGGMKASFAVGAMKYIAEAQIPVTHIIAGSGSAGTAAYFIAQQYDDMVRIRTDKLSTSSFINLLRVNKIIDIDYLIDTVFKEQVPLNISSVYTSGITFEIPVTNVATGQVRFKSPQEEDIFELLRATKAVPFAYNKKVQLSDRNYYSDGSNSSGRELGAERLIKLGCSHIIIIDNGAAISDHNMKAYTSLQTHQFSHNYQEEFYHRKHRRNSLKKLLNVTYITPIGGLHFGRRGIFNNNQQILQYNIEHGYQQAKKLLSHIFGLGSPTNSPSMSQ